MDLENNTTISQMPKANIVSRLIKSREIKTNSTKIYNQLNIKSKKQNSIIAKNQWHKSTHYTIGQTAW